MFQLLEISTTISTCQSLHSMCNSTAYLPMLNTSFVLLILVYFFIIDLWRTFCVSMLTKWCVYVEAVSVPTSSEWTSKHAVLIQPTTPWLIKVGTPVKERRQGHACMILDFIARTPGHWEFTQFRLGWVLGPQDLPNWELCKFPIATGSCFYPMTTFFMIRDV